MYSQFFVDYIKLKIQSACAISDGRCCISREWILMQAHRNGSIEAPMAIERDEWIVESACWQCSATRYLH